jgi:hypothetical protein
MTEHRSTKVETVSLEDPASVEEKSRRHGLPYLDGFLSDIASKQSGSDEAFGRAYQRDAIRTLRLETISPFTGEVIAAEHSINVRGRVFFHFADTTNYYVASSRIKVGYPLTALFVPEAKLLLKWDDVKGGIELIHVKQLKRAIGTPLNGGARREAAVMLGHRNFAHHFWNELSALERLVETRAPSDPPPRLIAAREPLGRLETIFPEISGWRIDREGACRGGLVNDPETFFVNLGGFRISSKLRQRIVQHAEAIAAETTKCLIKEVRKRESPVFWLSVRTSKPTFVNQRDVLVAISRLLLAKFASCTIMFDGFSIPEDHEIASVDMKEFYKSMTKKDNYSIGEIIGEVLEGINLKEQQFLHNISGLTVSESIALAQTASTYFCHLGTIQHKIGWTANKPGIIHGNRTILASKPEIWHATSVESGIQPEVIDSQLIADITPGQKSGDYRAVDCRALAESVVEYFDFCLSRAIGST